MASMKDYALKYAELGFGVIPINPKNKKPMQEFADKPKMSVKQITEFWTEHPNANIALRTIDFFVIDIDLHGEQNGFESLKKWSYLHLITETLQAKTASGGKHIFYFKRHDIDINQMIGLLPGVDIKAHPNNYVLVAPSATDKGQYEWDLEKSKENGTIVTASKELVLALKETYKKAKGGGLRDLRNRTYSERTRSATTDLFETIAVGFGDEGGRNDKLASFVGGLLKRAVDDEFVYELAKIANNNSLQPLPLDELDRTVESMIKKDRR
ncbi:DNA primase [Streptococcus iniae]|nr:DNA primase [Streptococcus iniae]